MISGFQFHSYVELLFSHERDQLQYFIYLIVCWNSSPQFTRLPVLLFLSTQELMYKRVPFIENPWYDDHFDIPTERQRIGKTLTVLTGASTKEDALSRGYQIIGWALYEKLDRLQDLMRHWLEDSSLTTAVNLSEVRVLLISFYYNWRVLTAAARKWVDRLLNSLMQLNVDLILVYWALFAEG